MVLQYVVAETQKPITDRSVEDASERWMGVIRRQMLSRIDPKLNTLLRTLVKKARTLSDGAELVRLPENAGKRLYRISEDHYPLTTNDAVVLVSKIEEHALDYKLGVIEALADIYVEMADGPVGSFNEVASVLERDSATHIRAFGKLLAESTSALLETKSYRDLMKLTGLLRVDLEAESDTITEKLVKNCSRGREFAGNVS